MSKLQNPTTWMQSRNALWNKYIHIKQIKPRTAQFLTCSYLFVKRETIPGRTQPLFLFRINAANYNNPEQDPIQRERKRSVFFVLNGSVPGAVGCWCWCWWWGGYYKWGAVEGKAKRSSFPRLSERASLSSAHSAQLMMMMGPLDFHPTLTLWPAFCTALCTVGRRRNSNWREKIAPQEKLLIMKSLCSFILGRAFFLFLNMKSPVT